MGKKGDWEKTGELPELPHTLAASGPQEEAELPRRKKRHVFTKIILTVLILVVLFTAALLLLGKRPDSGSSGRSVTVLLAGTDEGGQRTDTIILANINMNSGDISLVSIPRDTYVDTAYSVPKINSAYGWKGFGKDGMQELCTQVAALTNVKPDGYVLFNLKAFAEIVDLLGGVDYNVPQDMYYEDPYQDLKIDLKAGPQHLDGKDALGVVRFRSGYAMADLKRVEVQRDFIKTALKQWSNPINLLKLPKLFMILKREVLTDLSVRNVLWFLRVPLRCDLDKLQNTTLPGQPQDINGGSYYLADAKKVQALVEERFK